MTPSVQPGSARAWLLASRPQTLPAGAVPVLVGSACAQAAGGFSLVPALAAMAGALLIQIGTNFANDLYDFKKGTDADDRLGPMRAAQAGWLTPTQLGWGVAASFGAATAAGVYLTWVAGPIVIAIGLLSLTAGLAYTAGPLPLAYHGLGDVFVMLFFGFVAVCGSCFVQLGQVPANAWICAWSTGALATAVLVVNNLRDEANDRRAGKRTTVVRFGRGFGVGQYMGLLASAPLSLVVLWPFVPDPRWLLLPLLLLPHLARLAFRVRSLCGAELNPMLGSTARAMTLWGTLLSLSLIMGAQ